MAVTHLDRRYSTYGYTPISQADGRSGNFSVAITTHSSLQTAPTGSPAGLVAGWGGGWSGTPARVGEGCDREEPGAARGGHSPGQALRHIRLHAHFAGRRTLRAFLRRHHHPLQVTGYRLQVRQSRGGHGRIANNGVGETVMIPVSTPLQRLAPKYGMPSVPDSLQVGSHSSGRGLSHISNHVSMPNERPAKTPRRVRRRLPFGR